MTTAARFVCPALVLFLFGACVYRAATQSITHDEARSYFEFYSGGPLGALAGYEAGNHVLQSVLSASAVRVFGLSELSLRLPTLAGALLYLVAAWRLSVWLFFPGWRAALSVALLGLNPFLLDYLSPARGYGLGLGLFLWGLYEAARYLEDDRPSRLYRAGICCGLAIASTLIFLYPVLALAGVVAGLGALEGRQRFWTVADNLIGPAIVVSFLILAVPLTHLARGAFYFGASTLRESIYGVIEMSWLRDEGFRATALGRWLFRVIANGLVPGTVLAAAILSARRVRHARPLRREYATLILATATLLLTIVLAVLTKYVLGLLYPVGRTAVYWAPLWALVAVLVFEGLHRSGWRIAAAACLVFLLGSAVLFAAGFTTSYYGEWRYDSGTKRIVRRIAEDRRPSVRLGASWALVPSLNFYRQRYGLRWLAPVDRGGPDGEFDYYILVPRDRGVIDKRGLRVLSTDPVSQQILAVKW